jgi:hypothetical protein
MDRRSSSLSFVRAVQVALLVALAAPAAAHADATLVVSGTAPNKTLTFTVGDALGHSTSASTDTGDLVITDDVGIAVGASGCTALDANTARCGPAGGFERVVFAFGDGNDGLGVSDSFPIDISADGGPGDDVINAGAGDDLLVGGPANDVLDGRYGNDELAGGNGDDYLSGDLGIDRFDGGDGADYLDASDAPEVADAAILCGPGADTLRKDDDVDTFGADCETTEEPRLVGTLVITGEPAVGSVLTLSTPTNVGGNGTVTISWVRCHVVVFGCETIAGASGTTYTRACRAGLP